MVEDQTYRKITRESGLLGFPTLMTYALIRLRRRAADFVARPKVSDVLEVSQRPIALATRVPPLDTGRVARLIGKTHYLPPLIELLDEQSRAFEEWQRSKPPFMPWIGAPPDILGASSDESSE
jgi:hypothetical protein